MRNCCPVPCPVEGCVFATKSLDGDGLRRHFVRRHFHDTSCILQEGLVPLSKCELCGMYGSHWALWYGRHRRATCREGAVRVRRRHALAGRHVSHVKWFSRRMACHCKWYPSSSTWAVRYPIRIQTGSQCTRPEENATALGTSASSSGSRGSGLLESSVCFTKQ